jgi:hypothetical protein
MNTIQSYDNLAAVILLNGELKALKDLQDEALRVATFGGMTADEAEEFDERNKRIANIKQELEILNDS